MVAGITRLPLVVLLLAYLFQINQLRAQSGGWTAPIRINGDDTLNTVTYASMAINREGKIFVVWQHFSERPYNIRARLYFASFDGQNWSPEIAITDADGTAWTPDIAVDTLGLPHVVWGEYSSGEIYHQWYDGTTWSTPENVSQDSGSSYAPRIAIDKKNRIHVVWHDDTPGDWTIFYRSFDGASWSGTVNISDSLVSAGYPSIAVDSKDDIHVAFDCYTGPSPLNNYDIFYRSRNAGVWSRLVQLTNDPRASNYAEVAVKPNDWPVVVWQQVVDNTIVRVYSTSFDGFSWTSPTSIADSAQSYEPSIAIDNGGRAHVVWQLGDPVHRTSQVLYSFSSGSGWSVPLKIAGSIPNPAPSKITVDTAGYCHVVLLARDNGIYYSRQTRTDGVTADRTQPPETAVLEQNYPNPFNPQTVVRYTLPQAERVTFRVYDILGREVMSLLLGDQAAGEHSLVFEASELSSGTYFYQIHTDQRVLTRKMIIVR